MGISYENFSKASDIHHFWALNIRVIITYDEITNCDNLIQIKARSFPKK
jgi:hypothetical protein